MSSERGGGLGAAFVPLIFVGAVAKFWVWIAVAFGAAVLFGLLLWLAFYAARRVDERENARKAIAGRADQQHAWVLADDERGTFGDYRPAV
jgi:ABC-type Fe3+-siderophore transport system permease subunit